MSVAILLILMLTLSCFYIVHLIPLFTGQNDDYHVNAKSCKHHVLIVGGAEDDAFLSKIYDGAQAVSGLYDCVVELHVSKTYSDDKTLQKLFDYASFTNPDGIITCIPEDSTTLNLPVNRNGKEIPLITLAQYNPNVPQVAYIGTNYSELGRKIAMESISYLSGSGNLAILSIPEERSPNYSTLMNSLTNTLAGHENIHITMLDTDSSEATGISTESLKRMILSGAVNLFVCLTTEDTIRLAQLITELHKEGKTGIIGFGQGEVLDTYLKKGAITELLSIDSEKIGRTAMKELFDYIRDGYANNYIAADVSISRTDTLKNKTSRSTEK